MPLVTIIGARNAIESFFQVDQALEMLRVTLVTILAREMRLKFFEVDQRMEMLRVPIISILALDMRLRRMVSLEERLNYMENCLSQILVQLSLAEKRYSDQFPFLCLIFYKFLKSTKLWRCCECLHLVTCTILAREMQLKILRSRPSFGDVASGAGHDVGARNTIETFRSRPTFGDVASAAGYDIGARNAIEFFGSRPSFGDVASAASHDIGVRTAIESFFQSRPSFGDIASAASHDIGARNAIEIFRSRPTFGDVASGASHDIGARNAIESFFNLIWCQTANNVTSRAQKSL